MGLWIHMKMEERSFEKYFMSTEEKLLSAKYFDNQGKRKKKLKKKKTFT